MVYTYPKLSMLKFLPLVRNPLVSFPANHLQRIRNLGDAASDSTDKEKLVVSSNFSDEDVTKILQVVNFNKSVNDLLE